MDDGGFDAQASVARWAAAWAVAMFLASIATLTLYEAWQAWRDPATGLWSPVAVVLWSWLIGLLFHLPMAFVVALLRWAWTCLAPPDWQQASWAAAMVGAAAATTGFVLVFAAMDPSRLPWHLAASPPLLLCGAAAGYLAHWWVSPFGRRYWIVLAATAVVGVLTWLPFELWWGFSVYGT